MRIKKEKKKKKERNTDMLEGKLMLDSFFSTFILENCL
jgi:hypothetical protein